MTACMGGSAKGHAQFTELCSGPPRPQAGTPKDHAHTATRARRWWAIFAVGLMFALPPAGACASGLPSFGGFAVPDASGSVGSTAVYRSVPASASVARGELTARLGRALARQVDRAAAASQAATAPGQRVQVTLLTLGATGTAQEILGGWRAAVRRSRERPVSVSVGAGGWVLARNTGVTLVWRAGASVGVVDVRAAGAAYAQRVAQTFAQMASARTPAPRTAFGKVLSNIRSDGSVSRLTAMQAFSLAYVPLPGVRLPTGAPVQIDDGSLAADWILPYRSTLTRTQQRIVNGALGLESNASGARAATLGDSSFVESNALTAQVDGYIRYYVAQNPALALPLGTLVVAGTSTDKKLGGNPYVINDADSSPRDSNGQFDCNYKVCRVRLLPDRQKELVTNHAPGEPTGQQDVNLALAHEAFHCLQYGWEPTRDALGTAPWLKEGMAEWAAYKATGTLYGSLSNINTYITTPGTPLFTRTYDAVGFFGHIDDVTGNFFATAKTVFVAGDTSAGGSNEAAFAAAGGGTGPILNTWGSSLLRLPAGGPAWTMISPAIPPDFATLKPGPPYHTIGDSGGDAWAAPYATAQAQLNISNAMPLIHVRTDGPARMFSLHHGELTNVTDVWLRVDGQQGCPDGTQGNPPASIPWNNTSFLGIAGAPGTVNTHASIESHALDEFCKPQPKPPSGGCNVGVVGASHDQARAQDGVAAAGDTTADTSTCPCSPPEAVPASTASPTSRVIIQRRCSIKPPPTSASPDDYQICQDNQLGFTCLDLANWEVSVSANVGRGLVEREAELERLRRVLDDVGAGSGVVMVVEGPAGIGKSELLAAARAGAQARGLAC
jgi:hypothetical protein